jgi:hypothetical protein
MEELYALSPFKPIFIAKLLQGGGGFSGGHRWGILGGRQGAGAENLELAQPASPAGLHLGKQRNEPLRDKPSARSFQLENHARVSTIAGFFQILKIISQPFPSEKIKIGTLDFS